MSDPSGPKSTTDAKDDAAVTETLTSPALGDESLLDIPASEPGDKQDVVEPIPPEPIAEEGEVARQDKMDGEDRRAASPDIMSGEAFQGEQRSTQSAEDIEKEASEHLARRAAEMDIGSGPGADAGEKPGAQSHDEGPPVPEKDTVKSDQAKEEEEYDEKHPPAPPNEETPNDVPEAPKDSTEATGLEIQNIMDQFRTGLGGSEDEIMSPRLERQQPMLVLPPRTSSLENKDSHALSPQKTGGSISSQAASTKAGKAPSITGASLNQMKSDDQASIASGKASTIFQPPPPSPEPEPALPFDFHRFLEQLRHRTADPVARFLRSFLNEFGKKQWMVHEQVKIISDFLEFISKKMGQCEVWRTVSDAEFDNAREGMEKLVMNRLYSQTFSPAIPPAAGSPRKAGKNNRSAADMANPQGPGRRGQHQEDVERDEVIAQKIRIYGWIKEEHLDIPPINEKGRKFLLLAQQELLKINTYRAPRDKVICVLNCCKVIFGFLKNSKSDQSADSFVPILIYTVLRAAPEHLVSNVQYIWRFRNQDKLGGEAGYYMSSLMGAVTFIENLDRTILTISDEEFERNVEQAVSAIAEKNKAEDYESRSHTTAATGPGMQHLNEKSALSRPEVTPRNSMDAERSSPHKNASQRLGEKGHHSSPSGEIDDYDAVTGLLKTIQKPLSSIGRIFSDDGGSSNPQGSSSLRPASTPLPGSTPRRRSPAPPGGEGERRPSPDGRPQAAAARQASAEVAQAQRVRAKEYKVVVE